MLEKKLTSAVLSLIRARQPRPLVPSNSSRVPIAPAKLREAQFSDFEEVKDLKDRWGLRTESLENWDRLWRNNPALTQQSTERPIGWVLEARGHVVGYLGNISLLYRFGTRTLRAVTASAFVVDPQYRAISLSLVAAFFQQTGVDLFLSTTAIEASAKIARAFKASPLPQRDYDTVLFWVLRPGAFAQAVMRKLAVGAAVSQLSGLFAAVPIGTDRIMRKRWPRKAPTHLKVTEIPVSEIGEDFERLFTGKIKDGILLADRTPGALRWHFEIPGCPGTARVLCCHENQELMGYLIARDYEDRSTGLRRSSVADMLAKEDNPDIFRALLIAAYENAKRSGSDVLELLGFPRAIRQICDEWSPYRRQFPVCPFYYKGTDPQLHSALASESAWYASPYDGDTSLAP